MMLNFYSITFKEEKKNEKQDGMQIKNNILIDQKEQDLRRVFHAIVQKYPSVKSHTEALQGGRVPQQHPKYKQQYQSSKISNVLTGIANGSLDEERYRLGKQASIAAVAQE